MKFLLMPLSWLYGLITYTRNKLYDKGILPSYRSRLKTIVIGNLQVGGAGKTPQTAFLYKWLSGHYQTAILSRGYGRKTKGLIEADESATPDSIGDEPFWYWETLHARVVVAEKRKQGLQYLEKTNTRLVLLDDAYQHRSVKADIYLMLTDYRHPYYRDFPLPAGRLREYRSEDKRADVIIMTKCPETITLQEKVDVIQRIDPYDHQHIFFTSVKPGRLIALKGRKDPGDIRYDKIIVLSGIANPASFEALCRQFNRQIEVVSFKDHHDFNDGDIARVNRMLSGNTIVMTTEKDAVKLKSAPLYGMIPEDRFFVLPIDVSFLFGEEHKFRNLMEELLADNQGRKAVIL